MRLNERDFRKVVEEHQGMVFSIALRLLGDHGFAEEVAQDCFVELHRSLDRLETRDHIRFWLRRVAVHRATDATRRRALRPESQATVWDDDLEIAGPGKRSMANPALEIRIESVLQTLPEPMRVAIVLRYQEEMRPDEIAALLAQPLASVKSNLQRGLGLLRRKADVMLKEFVR